MRYWKQITIFTLFSFFAQGQSITYKVVKDTPDDIANYWINVGVLDLAYGTKNPSFGNAGFSLNTVVHYKNKFGGELTYRNYYFALGEAANDDSYVGSNSHFEIGGFYNFASKTSSKNQKVILREKGKGYSEVSMKIPATMQRTFGLRAGFNMHNGALDATIANHGVAADDMKLGSKSGGLYLGILMTSSLNMRSHTVEYGIKNTGFVRRNYLDVMINPINKITNLDGSDFTGTIKKGIIGFRLGVEFMKPEPKKMMKTAKYQKLEIGSRPIDGYYALYTIGFNFKRKVKSMSSFKVVREKE